MIDHDNLDSFADAVNYDQQDTGDDGVAFYSGVAKEIGDPLLELACGTGRVAIPIARLGFNVTGLDIVPGMLQQARSKSVGLSTRWIRGDARSFDLGEHFRLIFMTGNAFQAFVTNAEQQSVLQRVHAHLESDGWFAFETRNPLFPNTRTREGYFPALETHTDEVQSSSYTNADGYEVRVSTTQTYDHATQILHIFGYDRWHEAGQERIKTTRTALRYTFPQELNALLDYNGFSVLRQYGDWDLQPLTAISPSIISICGKQPTK